MRREARNARADWQTKVEALGLVWHTTPAGPYWDESAAYVFERREIDAIERATAELYRLLLQAGQAVIDRDLFPRFGIPGWCSALIAEAWEAEPPALNYGRFDLGYDGSGPPKLFEFNGDTPTSLLEAAVVQWAWKEEVAPADDQFNALHDKLAAKWREIAPLLGSPVHFLHVADAAGEDSVTTAYHRDLAEQAGVRTLALTMGEVGWDSDARRFVGLENEPIGAAFHLYPWEWLVNEAFAANIAESLAETVWIEPIWKMIWSNKAILPILWELNPGHPNLLEAHEDSARFGLRAHVRKPKLAREGANVQLWRQGRVIAETTGDYGHEGAIAQALYDIPDFGAGQPVLGAWIVDGEPAGLGVREGGLITDNTARFVPHVIRG